MRLGILPATDPDVVKASQVRLTADLGAGRDVEQPSVVRTRYVPHTQGSTPLTVTRRSMTLPLVPR